MVELEPIWIDWPHARIRRELDIDHGTVIRFVVQLEYNVAAHSSSHIEPDWRVVARFDHDAMAPGGHDVTEEGLHLDIYRDGHRYQRLRGFPLLPAGRAMRFAEETFRVRARRLLARFEQWHDIDRRK